LLKHDFIREKWRNQCLKVFFFILLFVVFHHSTLFFLCEMLIALGFPGVIVYITQSRPLTINIERQMELPMTMKFGESFKKFALKSLKVTTLFP
jgi:hypothetical protein